MRKNETELLFSRFPYPVKASAFRHVTLLLSGMPSTSVFSFYCQLYFKKEGSGETDQKKSFGSHFYVSFHV
jgi:hypothetical protein